MAGAGKRYEQKRRPPLLVLPERSEREERQQGQASQEQSYMPLSGMDEME